MTDFARDRQPLLCGSCDVPLVGDVRCRRYGDVLVCLACWHDEIIPECAPANQ